ncbi:exported hypothetical protein [Candidatus Zixiibacteriota bacterium]|nr:exported hypothetical protein [candidate division Zixibacteria bacterium]
MVRLKLLVTGAVSFLFILFAASSVFGAGSVFPAGSESNLTGAESGIEPTSLWPPQFDSLDTNDSFFVCTGSTIYDTIKAVSTALVSGKLLTLTKISGPGDFSSTPSPDTVYGYFSYRTNRSESFQVTYKVETQDGYTATATKTYNIFVNGAPVITTGDSSFYSCWVGEIFDYQIRASDPENDPLTYILLSGDGTINPQSGVLSFRADTSGQYCFRVWVSDSCAADTAKICLNVKLNTPPFVTGFEKKILLCAVDTVCFSVSGGDPDPGDSIEIFQLDGPGIFEMVDSISGRTCFLPDNVDSATYTFIYGVTDRCARGEGGKALATPPLSTDTVTITVIITPGPQVTCPQDTSIFLCAPDTICLPIEGLPENLEGVTIFPGAVWYDQIKHSLCFYADKNEDKQIGVVVSSNCGVDSCLTNISVRINSAPIVKLGSDTTVLGCTPAPICLPVMISDSDRNISSVSTNLGDYSDGQICFTPPDAGKYTLVVTATDSCGAVGLDSLIITYNRSETVSLQCPEDTSIFLCAPDTICLPLGGVPEGAAVSVSPASAWYDKAAGTICFYTNCSVVKNIKAVVATECGKDSCGFAVNVTMNTRPLVLLGPDTTVNLCVPTEICLPAAVSDVDGNITNIMTSKGARYDSATGRVCVTPTIEGTNTVQLWAVDACGAHGVASAKITVKFNKPPVVKSAPDMDVKQCGLSEICFPVSISDVENDITSIQVSPLGRYDAGRGVICFTPPGGGTYSIITTAIDKCGLVGRDTTVVRVHQNMPPQVKAADTSVFLCEPETICVPVQISDTDTNIQTVNVSGGAVYSDGFLCFVPGGTGQFAFTIAAIDSCGAVGADTAHINVVINSAPVLSSADDFSIIRCDTSAVCFDITVADIDANLMSIGANFGSYDSEKHQICFSPHGPGTYSVIITAVDSCYAASVDTTFITVEKGPVPVISCPDTLLNVEGCVGIDSLCLNVPVEGADSVFVPDAIWHNGQICFAAPKTALEKDTAFMLIAANECGRDTCIVNAHMKIQDKPVIVSVDSVKATACAGETVCTDLAVSGADSVTVSGGATYIGGKLCVTAQSPGRFVIGVTAYGTCGVVTKNVIFKINIDYGPIISCPTSPIPVTICDPGNICVDLPISNYTNVRVDGGTWSNGKLCFNADKSGDYILHVTADGRCKSSTCDVKVTVTIPPRPAITCPTAVIDIPFCAPMNSCIDLPIANYDSVHVVGGTWANGKLCFDINQAGAIAINVMAFNQCGADTCTVNLNAVQLPKPEITCPESPINLALCQVGQVCTDIAIANADSVVTDGGSWLDGKLCFTPEGSGTHIVKIRSYNQCGVDSCQITYNISVAEPLVMNCPVDTTINLCAPSEICRPVSVSPAGTEIFVSPIGEYRDGNVCFVPDTAGSYEFTVKGMTGCAEDSCQFKVRVLFNEKPVIAARDSSYFICRPGDSLEYPVKVSDYEGDLITFRLLTGYGSINAEGIITFAGDTTGNYCFTVEARDKCAADTAQICLSVTSNKAPQVISAPDTTVNGCSLGTVCISVEVNDPDNNITSVVSNLGSYSDGQVCFTPSEAGNYSIITTATDACGASDIDTTIVSVTTPQPLTLECPRDTSMFICSPDTLCFPIGGIPTSATVTVSPPSAWYDRAAGSVCFYTNCSVKKDIKIVVGTDCGADSCLFSVNVTMNTRPLVLLGPDTTIFMCQLGEICIPAAISDVDNNISSILPSRGARFDQATGRLCFTPAAEGISTVQLRAIDSCGGFGLASAKINVILNKPPIVKTSSDLDLLQCTLSEVCFPAEISDSNNNITSITVSPLGHYDSQKKMICFTPSSAGTYSIITTAVDTCGLTASDTTTVKILLNTAPAVVSAADSTITLCSLEPVCFPVTITDADNNVSRVEVSNGGTYSNGQVCFTPSAAGDYSIIIIAYDSCGASATDTTKRKIILNSRPVVIGPDDFTVMQCSLSQICFNVAVSDIDGNITSVITSLGTYNAQSGQVCFTPTGSGSYGAVITATDKCGLAAVDTVNITVNVGQRADIVCPSGPININLCQPDTICQPLTITPINALIALSYGAYSNGTLCFRADTSGHYNIRVIAGAECGADTCNIQFNVFIDQAPEITCPSLPTTASLCRADSVRIILPITPANATVTVLPKGRYSFSTHMVSFLADTAGTYNLTVIASTTCGADTCHLKAIVTMEQVPQLTCPGSIDTTICLTQISEICFPVTLVGANAAVVVTPSGHYSGGMVCVPITGAGTYPVKIIASTLCGSDTCITNLTVHGNNAPVLTVHADTTVLACDDDLKEICLDGIFAIDAEHNSLSITKTCGPGAYNAIRSDSGQICFTPTRTDTTYTFCFEATDGCQTVSKNLAITVNQAPDCNVCVDLAIQTDSCVVVGSTVPVRLKIKTRDQIGGFDLLISYDASVLSILNASRGTDISGWEYFTYRLGTESGCGSGCPTGLVRVVGIADINNGSAHPPQEQLLPDGILAVLMMKVANDQNLGGQFLPIGFYWNDCGDNAFSDPSGSGLYVDARIYGPFGDTLWDEYNDIKYPETGRITGLGAPDTCVTGDKNIPVRCIDFHFGGICVKHPDSIDARGDVNLNGIAYEIGDAVVYTNYFLFGLKAFTVNVDGQIAASDVNADGLTLTVADLVYLVRVITGDAVKVEKLTPNEAAVELLSRIDGHSMAVSVKNELPIGGGFLRFRFEGIIPSEPVLAGSCEGMDYKCVISGNEIRILLYSFDLGHKIAKNAGELFTINFGGTGKIELAEASFAGYYGETLASRFGSAQLPSEFALSQNYPNPFNPITSIDLSLPTACQWHLTIYNVSGQVVRRMSGDADAGRVTVTWDGRSDSGQQATSGIYLYKVNAGTFSATKKMMLLK